MGMGYAPRLFASMPSSSKLSHTEDEQHQDGQLQQEAKQELQSQDTAEEKMALERQCATPSPRRKLSSLSSGSFGEALEEDEIATVRRKTQRVNFGPVNVVVLESEELLHDLSENLQSALAKASPKSPPAPPTMHTCPSPPRCEQHMTFNAARRKARVRSA